MKPRRNIQLTIPPALLYLPLVFVILFARVARSQPMLPVSRLQASHVAEIHTGGVTEQIALEFTGKTEPTYRVVSRRDAERFEVSIHGNHGRLMSIDRIEATGRESLYRWPGVRVIAHRGGVLLGPPENTLPAIEKAIEIEADIIEIDIRQTSDGQLVLMHDETVDRTTNGRGRVDAMTLAEIQRLEIQHDGTQLIRVPTLREALAAMRGKIDPDLDFKEGDLAPLLSVLRELQLTTHATMHASWPRCLQVVADEPAIRIRPTAEFPAQIPGMIRSLRPAIVNLDWHAVTEQAIRDAHVGGCHAMVNCLGDADTPFYLEEAIRIGADYIQTDDPARVIAALRRRGMRDRKPPLGDPLGTPLRAPRLKYPLR